MEKQEDAQTIQVYLWSTSLYENYAPYIQSQLPDVNIEFIVGNNDLDFTSFAGERRTAGYHHLLPLLAARCGSLKDSLMNLALTNEAGAVYNTYLSSVKTRTAA